MKNRVLKQVLLAVSGLLCAGMLAISPVSQTISGEMAVVSATESQEDDSNRIITDADRQEADEVLFNFKESLKIRYHMDAKNLENVEAAFYQAVYQIANNDMTVGQMWDIVSSAKAAMESAATGSFDHFPTNSTSEFLMIADNWTTPTVYYGRQVAIVLPIMNFGTEELKDLIIEPIVDNSVDVWPFKLTQTGYLQTEPFIPGSNNRDVAFANRREFTYYFTARDDVRSGYYPLTFKVSYTKGGVRCSEPAELTIFVKTVGKPENGYIGGTGTETTKAKPRIIVTGFETSPAQVYAGDTFTLTIHVKNTSADQTVTNVLFDMQAAVEGSDNTNTYSAFLPTSGSSSVYMNKIGTNSEADIVIEMTAKADLAQKPYVLDVNMKYDAGATFDLTDKASVSIPIFQESKFDTSIPEIAPTDLSVGEQTNVMFSIYNTGKTTLYNVQVKFVADSFDEASAFVGNLQSGNTGNIDVMLNAIAPTMDDGTVIMQISYEDDAGNVTTVEKPITIWVSEVFYDDMPMGDDFMMDDMGMEDAQKGPNRGLIIGIVAAILAICTIVIGVIVRKRKKKKDEDDLLEE